jgi:hypothetical protein
MNIASYTKNLALPASYLSRRGDKCSQFSQNLGVRSVEFNAARDVEARTGSGGWAAGDGQVRRRRRRGAAASVDGPARLTR